MFVGPNMRCWVFHGMTQIAYVFFERCSLIPLLFDIYAFEQMSLN